ncbi:MAG: diguanylate cyclase [Lachnospiraceae bacterium]|nr:diguanylate cyclase [Lachnospiraceae bacterium]
MYHTKKIGVFVSHIVGEYQRRICQGIIDQASESGYCVEIFSSTDEKISGNYRLGEESILRIPNFDNFLRTQRRRFRYLDNYNKLHTKKYIVSASIGVASETISPNFDLRLLIEKADQAMYEQKRSKPKHRK